MIEQFDRLNVFAPPPAEKPVDLSKPPSIERRN
jgi:hypothetical protein